MKTEIENFKTELQRIEAWIHSPVSGFFRRATEEMIQLLETYLDFEDSWVEVKDPDNVLYQFSSIGDVDVLRVQTETTLNYWVRVEDLETLMKTLNIEGRQLKGSGLLTPKRKPEDSIDKAMEETIKQLSENSVQQCIMREVYDVVKDMDDTFDWGNCMAALMKLTQALKDQMVKHTSITETELIINQALRDWVPSMNEQEAIIRNFGMNHWNMDFQFSETLPETLKSKISEARKANQKLMEELLKYEHTQKYLKK